MSHRTGANKHGMNLSQIHPHPPHKPIMNTAKKVEFQKGVTAGQLRKMLKGLPDEAECYGVYASGAGIDVTFLVPHTEAEAKDAIDEYRAMIKHYNQWIKENKQAIIKAYEDKKQDICKYWDNECEKALKIVQPEDMR